MKTRIYATPAVKGYELIIMIMVNKSICYVTEGYADSLLMTDIDNLQYKFHITDTYNTANDETLTGSCAFTYT